MPLALPRRRALPNATLKSNKAGACSRFVKGKKKKKEKKARRKERRQQGARQSSSAKRGGKGGGKKKRRAREGREEDEDQEEKEREVSGEKRGGTLNVMETKPKRRIGEK